MPQQTNLNVSPYYDDFDPTKGYHRVLFKPGFPVQARELSTLQSILQNQVESFGTHMFKEGSMVVPGGVTFDPQYFAVQINPTHLGIDVGIYAQSFIGTRIRGQSTGVTAKVVNYITSAQSDKDYDTLYVKYINSNNSGDFSFFDNSEILIAEEAVTYGNTTINAGSTFASTISIDACLIGSAASVDDGIYFIRGHFVKVNKQTIILDQYNPDPSKRIGLRVLESTVSAKADETLYDNAKGFSNFAAPGGDRFKIELELFTKDLGEFDDTDFVEIVRVQDGETFNLKIDTEYNRIRDYLAKRTYDESGNYTVESFKCAIADCLNDREGNEGVYFDDQTTFDGNEPGEDLACLKISSGKAYVYGYDVDKSSPTIIDFDKTRDVEDVTDSQFIFEMGNKFVVNDVVGVATLTNRIDLYGGPNNSVTHLAPGTATKIGDAKIYNFGLKDSAYENDSTDWNLYLYDIQTYTELKLNENVSATEMILSSYIQGVKSGASGYAVAAGAGSSSINITQVSGTFIAGEKVKINGREDISRTVERSTRYGINDVYSFDQDPGNFDCQKKLTKRPVASIGDAEIKVDQSDGKVTSGSNVDFRAFKPGDVVIFEAPNTRAGVNTSVLTRNVVRDVEANGASMRVGAMTTISDLFDGGVKNFTGRIFRGQQDVSLVNSSLIAPIPDTLVENVDFTDSTLRLSAQVRNETTSATGVLVVSISSVDLDDVVFVPFDQEDYQVIYSNGTIATIDQSQVTIANGTQLTITGLAFSQSNVTVNVVVEKQVIKNKVKDYIRCTQTSITRSTNLRSGVGIQTSVNDGLNHSNLYGIRVQDREICLNYPDVANIVAVYESLDLNAPILDKLTFTSTDDIFNTAIVGELIFGETSKALATVVSIDSGSNQISVVYKNNDRFNILENLSFRESNTSAVCQALTPGKYRNITTNYILDKGQENQYYDYSRITKNSGGYTPSKQLLIIFNRFEVPASDTGDVFTVNSYNEERYKDDIPQIGPSQIFAHDVLDFRPRVSTFDPSTATVSPFFYTARDFSGKPDRILTPNGSCVFNYSFYLSRIDKLVLEAGTDEFNLVRGRPARSPIAPNPPERSMEVATILLPAYLRDTSEARVYHKENKRYTMRDIDNIAKRVANLEEVTTLSLLERSVESIQVKDANGLDRFKSGFFVDSFKDESFMHPSSPVDIDTELNELRPLRTLDTINLQLAGAVNLPAEQIDFNTDFELLDSENTQKTGSLVTLKYEEEVYLEQEFATRVNNVNPFHVVSYTGTIELTPSVDNWINTQRTQNTIRDTIGITVFNNQVTANLSVTSGALGGRANTTTREVGRTVQRDDIRSENTFIAAENFDPFCRSRNIDFRSIGLKPTTTYFPFFDNQGGIDVVPKLLQVRDVSGSFTIGETVRGTAVNGTDTIFEFRLCTPNHKAGAFNNPSETFLVNPYDSTVPLPNGYSQASTVLNVDTAALAEAAQGAFFGFAEEGMVLRGVSSGAQATVSSLQLVSDDFGDLLGSIFIQDPNQTPTPTVRIRSGTREFKLTSSQSNATPIIGETSISTAIGRYLATGTTRVVQTDIRVTTLETTTVTNLSTINLSVSVPPPPPPAPPAPPPPRRPARRGAIRRLRRRIRGLTRRVRTNRRRTRNLRRNIRRRRRRRRQRRRNRDPLAQSFLVGPEGAWITSIDVFFKTKSTGTTPVTCEIRTVELGLPTLDMIDKHATVTLRPNDVKTSDDGTVATNIKFKSPVYLDPSTQYAIVLLSESDEYECFCGEMGQKALNTQTLPEAQGRIYSQQWALGSLFKSQNGSTWTPTQFEDLTFKLYRAKFTSSTGTVTFHNPPIRPNNGYLDTLNFHPITSIPKLATLGIQTTTDAGIIGTVFAEGRKITETIENFRYGYIDAKGGPVTGTVGILTGGKAYGTPTNPVSTYNITGEGSGLTLNVTVSAGQSAITAATVVASGTGYKVGDVVGIVTAGTAGGGSGVRIGINTINGIDTLYLTDVQAEEFDTTSGTNKIQYHHDSGSIINTNLDILSYQDQGSFFTGEYFLVEQLDHGMYGVNNKVLIEGAIPSTVPTELSVETLASETTISIASTEVFENFEGVAVSAANTGYALLGGSEIISYTQVGMTSIGGVTRGADSTTALNHKKDTAVAKYELFGVSLRRINAEHDVITDGVQPDSYYVKIDRGTSRNSDDTVNDFPQLSFTETSSGGGERVHSTKNYLYDTVRPLIRASTFGGTDFITAQIRSVSGSSASGGEVSFIDQGLEEVDLNRDNELTSVRLIASAVNEKENTADLERGRSFTIELDLENEEDDYNSPCIDLETVEAQLLENRLNKPIDNYTTDPRANARFNDPHSSYYMSNPIYIKNPATSLKVLFDARRPASAEFRVSYSLLTSDSSSVPAFELFPGYPNLVDTDGSGFGDKVIDPNANTGLPDSETTADPMQYKEYEYSIDDLPSFTGFQIKIAINGTNQAEYPILKNLRALAIA